MLTHTLPYLALFLLSGMPLAADGDVNPPLPPAELPGMTITRLHRYEGKALYGYIDGGAELYHEYGFVSLTVQECLYEGEALTIELYHMKDSLAALGIFSVTRGQSPPADGFGPYSVESRYAVQWSASSHVSRVINATGSEDARRATTTVARALAQKLHGAPPPLPSWTASFGNAFREVKYMRGPLGIQNGFDSWSGALEGVARFEAYILPVSSANEAVVADIRFCSEGDRATVRERLARQTESRYVLWPRGSSRLIVLESQSAVDSLRSLLEACPGCPQ